jgi:peroxiredoxin
MPRPLSRPSPRRRQLLTAAGLLAAGAAATGIGLHLADRPVPAPVVDYTELDGTRRRSDALLGQVVLVTFWATTCAVCLAEMPELVALHRAHQGRGLQTLAVAMHYDPPARVAGYAAARDLPFPVVIDNTGEIARRFGPVAGTPTTVLIDRQGRIVQRHVGALDFTQLRARLDRLLAQA